VLISSAEPPAIVDIGFSSSVPEEFGADILIPTTVMGMIGVQRKEFPSDFIASLYDGRLSTSLVKLTQLPVRILLLEGRPAWDANGALMGRKMEFYHSTLRTLCWSAQVQLGISTYWTSGIPDTIDFLRDLKRWGDKEHNALFKRPGPPKGEQADKPMREWTREIGPRDRAMWILQGIDGVGPEVAGAIFDHFGRLPLRWDVTPEELLEVPGVGKGRVEKLRKEIR
jgi:ERCC4-type nuclease